MVSFPNIDYLEWIHGRPAAALHDLGSSDLRAGRPFEPVESPPSLSGLPDPPGGVTVETQLATEYGVHPEQVLVTAGTTHANYLTFAAAQSLAATDDKPTVAVEDPGYEPLVQTPRTVGADVERFSRHGDLDPAAVRDAVGPDTCLVVVTNRHNPTGELVDESTLSAVADAARDAGARLLVDEVYAPYVTDDQTADGAFGGVTAAGIEGAAVTNSLTKFFGLGDLRVGWLVGDRELVDRARQISTHHEALASTSRAMANRALYGADELTRQARTRVAEAGSTLGEFLDARPDVRGRRQGDCPYGFVEVAGADGEAVTRAADAEGVLVVPGRFFDMPEGVRVSLGGDPEADAAALRAFGDVLDEL